MVNVGSSVTDEEKKNGKGFHDESGGGKERLLCVVSDGEEEKLTMDKQYQCANNAHDGKYINVSDNSKFDKEHKQVLAVQRLLGFFIFISGVTLSLCIGLSLILYFQHCTLHKLSKKLQVIIDETSAMSPLSQDPTSFGWSTDGVKHDENRYENAARFTETMDSTSDKWEMEESSEDEVSRGKRKARVQGLRERNRESSSGRNTNRERRRRRCVQCNDDSVSVYHMFGSPRSIVKPSYGGAPRKYGTYKHWKLADWSTGQTNIHNDTTGKMAIKQSGIYWVYAQVTFLNQEEINGFLINVTKNSISPSHRTIARCTQPMVNAAAIEKRFHTCYTSLTTKLMDGDQIYIANMHAGHAVHFHEEFSYWGLVRLNPVNDPPK